MILGLSKDLDRRHYAKDPNLMSKSQFMQLRKACTMPYYYAHELGIDYENEHMRRGTDVHTLVEELLHKFQDEKFDVYNQNFLDFLPEYTDHKFPYIRNFLRIYGKMTNFEFNIYPVACEVVAQEGTEIGTLDYIWEMDNGDLAVIDLKTGKFPSSLSDIRIELMFYARLIGAKYIGAIYLGSSTKYPHGGFLFEAIKPQLEKRLMQDLEKTWEIRKSRAFKRTPTPLCSWCDYKTECKAECTKSQWYQITRAMKKR